MAIYICFSLWWGTVVVLLFWRFLLFTVFVCVEVLSRPRVAKSCLCHRWRSWTHGVGTRARIWLDFLKGTISVLFTYIRGSKEKHELEFNSEIHLHSGLLPSPIHTYRLVVVAGILLGESQQWPTPSTRLGALAEHVEVETSSFDAKEEGEAVGFWGFEATQMGCCHGKRFQGLTVTGWLMVHSKHDKSCRWLAVSTSPRIRWYTGIPVYHAVVVVVVAMTCLFS